MVLDSELSPVVDGGNAPQKQAVTTAQATTALFSSSLTRVDNGSEDAGSASIQNMKLVMAYGSLNVWILLDIKPISAPVSFPKPKLIW